MIQSRFWFTCLFPDKKGFFAGAKVHINQCMECEIFECPMKNRAFTLYFPRAVLLDRAPLNKKVVLSNRSINRKNSKARRYCPLKKGVALHCRGFEKFCLYNQICEKFRLKERKGTHFIKSIRWRKAMIYVVKFLDGTMKEVEKNDLAEINIDNVEIVYPGNLEVEVVTELVPLGQEAEKLQQTVETFREKYVGEVVTLDGVIDFEEWFSAAKTGEKAIIPEKALVPQKTYKVVRIKKNRVPAEQKKPVENTKAEKSAVEPEKKAASTPKKSAKKAKTKS